MPEFTAKELRTSTDEELAVLAERHNPLSSEGVLIDREWQRRERVAQHEDTKIQIELQHTKNMELITKQVRWIKFSAILTAISTLTAGIVGALLTYMLSTSNQPQQTKSEIQQIIQPQTTTSTSAPGNGKTNGKVP